MKKGYIVSTPLLLLIVFNSLLAGGIIGYGLAFLQWWNH